MARQLTGSMGVEIDDAATGRLLVPLEGTCAWDQSLEDDSLRDATPGCAPFPTTPFALWADDLRFSPDGSVLVGLDSTGYVVVWDAVTGRLLRTIESQGFSAGVLFTPDGREMIMGTDRNELLTYSTTTWKLTHGRSLDASVDTLLTPIRFVDEGRVLLAVGGMASDLSSGWIYRLDGSTFEVLGSRLVHTARLKAATVSPDGTQIATAAADGIVRVWDAGTFDLQHELRVAGQAQGVAFVDDTHLAVMPEAGDLLLMILDRDELAAKVRSTLTRGFTEAECEQFGFGGACPTLDELRSGRLTAP